MPANPEIAQVTSFPPALLGYLTFLDVTCAMHLFSLTCDKGMTLFCCICKSAEPATYRCMLGEPVESSNEAAEVLSLSS